MIRNSPVQFLLSLAFGAFFNFALQAQPLITASLVTPGNAGTLAEDCGGPYQLIIQREAGNTDTIEIGINALGIAILGEDYSFSPGVFPIILLPGENEVIIDILISNDGFPEGGESINWDITYTDGVNSGFIHIKGVIVDAYSIDIAPDTIRTCRGIPIGFEGTSNGEYHYDLEHPELISGSGWYYATIGSDTCGAKDSVYLQLHYGDIPLDTLYLCNDSEGVTIPGSISENENLVSFTWIPADSTLSDTTSLTPLANPAVTTTYVLQADFAIPPLGTNNCTTYDTVVVRVDSIPYDLHIDVAPLKAYYCAGEIVALFSPSYDSVDFPDIHFEWIPGVGTFLSDEFLLNAAIQLEDTTWYVRDVVNNACMSKDSILLNVVPSGVPLSVTDTTLCPGEQFTVLVLNPQVTEPEWTPEEGLSCVNCLDPTVTVTGQPGTNLTYMFSGKILECPVGASLTIHIPPIQFINIEGDDIVCEGDVVPLSINSPGDLSNLQWSITFGSATLSCTDCLTPSVTVTGPPPINVSLVSSTSDPAYCGAEGFFQLRPGVQPQIIGETFRACLGEEVIINSGNPEYTDLRWSVFSGELLLSCDDCPNPVVTVNGSGRIRLDAEVPQDDTCGIIVLFPIEPFTPDESNLEITEPAPGSGPIGQGEEVTVRLNVLEGPPTNLQWSINGVAVGGNTNIISFNANEEANFVEVTFKNSKGCEQTDTLTIFTVPPFFQIPNAFTPNNDDKNDRFRFIITGNIGINEFMIFNRWGQLVYEGPEDDLEGWDGTFKGEPASSDTYVYSAILQFPDGSVEIVKGDVMLIR